VEQFGKDSLVVILGSPNADSSELYAETVINGDPSWTGPLAGVSLGLDVFHIMEPEIRSQIDDETYRAHLELMEMALDIDAIIEGINRSRKK
jgi:hypothetical protein